MARKSYDPTLPPEIMSQQRAIDRQDMITQMLLAQSQRPIKSAPSKGRLQGNVSWTQGLAKIANALVAARMGKQSDEAYGRMRQDYQTGLEGAMGAYGAGRGGEGGVPLTTEGRYAHITDALASPFKPVRERAQRDEERIMDEEVAQRLREHDIAMEGVKQEDRRELVDVGQEYAIDLQGVKAKDSLTQATAPKPGDVEYEQDRFSAMSPNDLRRESQQNYVDKLTTQKPGQTISIGGKGETKATGRYGEGVGDAATKIDKTATESIKSDQNLDRIGIAIAQGADTGYGAETILTIRSLGNTLFGLELPEGLPEQEMIRTINNEMSLRLRNPDSGLGLTGNTSNADLLFLKNSVAGLARTEEGNRIIIDFLKRKNQMARDIAAEQARIIGEEGTVPLNLSARLLEYADNYQFLTEEERTMLQQFQSGTGSLTADDTKATGSLEAKLGKYD